MAGVDDKDKLVRYRNWFDTWADAKQAEIRETAKSRRYYHGNQWTKEEIAALRDRKQPIITANRIRRKIDGIVGVDSRYRQDPKAFGRTPQHDASASVATAAIRFVMDNNNWERLSDECLLEACISGIIAHEMTLEPDEDNPGESVLKLKRVAIERFFYDPRSQEADFSDAKYLGSYAWLDAEDVIEMFPDKAEEIKASVQAAPDDETFESRENKTRHRWVDSTRKLVRVVELWKRYGGSWTQCFFTGSVILSEQETPFVDDNGKPGHRYILQSAYIDEDGDRYGLVRDMISPQDEINHRRSKLLHQISVRQTWGRSGVVKDVNEARLQMARPDGHLEMEGEYGRDWGVIDQNDQIAGQAQLLQESKDEIENFGPNQALIGQGGVSDSSGRAIAMLQAAGMAELALFFGRVRNWKLRTYKTVWQNIRRMWTAERVIRVTDDPQSPQHLIINQLALDPYGNPTIQNGLAQLNVDLIIEESQDSVTLQSETFDKMVKLAQIGVPFPPEALIEMSDLDHTIKQRTLQRMQEAQAQQGPMQAAQAEMQMETARAEIDLKRANAEKSLAGAFKDQVTAQRAMVEPVGM